MGHVPDFRAEEKSVLNKKDVAEVVTSEWTMSYGASYLTAGGFKRDTVKCPSDNCTNDTAYFREENVDKAATDWITQFSWKPDERTAHARYLYCEVCRRRKVRIDGELIIDEPGGNMV